MSSGWSDHLADPDAWEEAAEALRDRADDDRKRSKEDRVEVVWQAELRQADEEEGAA